MYEKPPHHDVRMKRAYLIWCEKATDGTVWRVARHELVVVHFRVEVRRLLLPHGRQVLGPRFRVNEHCGLHFFMHV